VRYGSSNRRSNDDRRVRRARDRDRSDQAITATVLAERLAAGYGDDDLDASRRGQPVPRLAAWSLATGICATVGANLAHGVGHGPVGALVSALPALALVGSFELLMMLIRTRRGTRANDAEPELRYQPAPSLDLEASRELPVAPTLEQTVRGRYEAGHSQRAIARELNIDRRKVKRLRFGAAVSREGEQFAIGAELAGQALPQQAKNARSR
jgi:hypothetical protein